MINTVTEKLYNTFTAVGALGVSMGRQQPTDPGDGEEIEIPEVYDWKGNFAHLGNLIGDRLQDVSKKYLIGRSKPSMKEKRKVHSSALGAL